MSIPNVQNLSTMKTAFIFTLAVLACYLQHSSAQGQSAAGQQLKACFQKYEKDPACPQWQKALTCVQGVTPITEFDRATKSSNTIYIEDRLKTVCSYLANQNTCVEEFQSQCLTHYNHYRAEDNPNVCGEVKKVKKCVNILKDMCPDSRRYISFPYKDLKETTRLCDAGYYQGSCSPMEVDVCLKPIFNHKDGIQYDDHSHICKQAKVKEAKRCLQTLKPSCTIQQEKYYETNLSRLSRCPLID